MSKQLGSSLNKSKYHSARSNDCQIKYFRQIAELLREVIASDNFKNASGDGMLRFVMYTVIEALVPVTNMAVTAVRHRGEILSLHQLMLTHLRQ